MLPASNRSDAGTRTNVEGWWLTGRHSQRAVEPDDLAVEHLVLDDVRDQRGELVRASEARGERHDAAQRLARVLGQVAEQRRVEGARRDRADAHAAACTASASVTSVGTKRARSPSSPASASPRS